MTIQFKVGDKVRLSGKQSNPNWDQIYLETFKVGIVTGYWGTYKPYGNLVSVKFDGSHRTYHYPAPDLAYLSIIYSENHLKDKDVL